MPTKQDFVNFIKTIPGAADAIGQDKLDQWVAGEIFGVEDKWFVLFQAEGGDNHVANIIAQFLNIPSVGYDDFSNAKQKTADAYRGYIAGIKNEIERSNAILKDLNDKLNHAAGDQAQIIGTEITVESGTLNQQMTNLSTWQSQLNAYLTANPSVV